MFKAQRYSPKKIIEVTPLLIHLLYLGTRDNFCFKKSSSQTSINYVYLFGKKTKHVTSKIHPAYVLPEVTPLTTDQCSLGLNGCV